MEREGGSEGWKEGRKGRRDGKKKRKRNGEKVYEEKEVSELEVSRKKRTLQKDNTNRREGKSETVAVKNYFQTPQRGNKRDNTIFAANSTCFTFLTWPFSLHCLTSYLTYLPSPPPPPQPHTHTHLSYFLASTTYLPNVSAQLNTSALTHLSSSLPNCCFVYLLTCQSTCPTLYRSVWQRSTHNLELYQTSTTVSRHPRFSQHMSINAAVHRTFVFLYVRSFLHRGRTVAP